MDLFVVPTQSLSSQGPPFSRPEWKLSRRRRWECLYIGSAIVRWATDAVASMNQASSKSIEIIPPRIMARAVDSIAATTFWLLFMEALTTCEVNLSNELAFVAVKSSTHIEHISRDDIEWVRSIKPRLN